ncbi:Meiosis-specific transcription factor mei4, putative [Pediculus humanus corporis]|uniref:Meiosis-specific transcription factor mei4, putative n=1 Tax=Pediculus humanus subsp. corporis TaxID=121224 RepID=E0VAZ9_PEDHC|nr:Meiosis-specific transcription factor mei4, putative [Pediculus humanus corporis]EEB10555.1 Meiosis-specific transcription factor mei4, putative [Pediculus humanus corporis]
MDYYLSSQSLQNGPDSLSLQEMLDMDIKSENDFENIFSCGAPGDNNVWLTSSSDSHSLLGGDINSSLSLDLSSGETRMVCPNSVIPVTVIQIPYDNTETNGNLKGSFLGENEDDEDAFHEEEYLKHGISFSSDLDIKQEYITESEEEETFQEAYARAVAIKSNQTNKGKPKTPVANQISKSNNHVINRTPVSTKKSVSSVRSINAKKRLQDYGGESELVKSSYPKPAYSYSCLIAMALKNSPNGSLPVSEIYNFMCEHFPYFKTAPNGWKNSVRHNLSLNKCFEKIEKPATNGSQRKGCLWAMNPKKIGKMDEEVQKWSKKDKLAIKKSMVYPESLDALERGELSGNYNQNLGSIETIHSEMESEEEAWDQTRQNSWDFKREDVSECENNSVTARLSAEQVKSVFPSNDEEFDDSDISLTDFDIEVAESIYNEIDSPIKKKMRLNITPQAGAFTSMSGIGLSGGATYTFNSQTTGEISPKRFKSLGGNTISGNYVYKPLGTPSSRRKSPLRPTILSSLEADD